MVGENLRDAKVLLTAALLLPLLAAQALTIFVIQLIMLSRMRNKGE